MTLQDLHIGKKVYLISKEGKITRTEITSIDKRGTVYVDLKNYNGHQIYFMFGDVKLNYRYSHSYEHYLYISYDESDVAVLKRNLVIEEFEKLKASLDDAFNKVKRHREMNWDILNTDDISKWISEFQKNKHW